MSVSIYEGDDFTLLANLKQRDTDAFNWLYTKHRGPLMFLAMSILKDMDEAKDLVQDFFADFWQDEIYQRIDANGKTNGFLKGYLNRAVYNRSLNRANQLKKIEQKTAGLPIEDNSLTPEQIRKELDWREGFGSRLEKALEFVPPLSRRVFELTYLEEKSRNQIAETMGTSPHTVKNQLLRAMKILREKLKNFQYE